ncbi:hypothetical protein Fmac_015566 [Flemingia macrophylla]|uniref:DUF4408 domain-containing protein n=1 Tax=Flemingia macrophylla TaxID=520843 RepID=A0ABD1MFT7_9FABA
MPVMDLFQNPSSSLKSNRFETAMWAAKFVLMSMGVISTLVLLKVAIVPYTFHLILSTLPQFWVSLRSWLTLPFLYIIVNFIIITIAASSKINKPKPFSESDSKHTSIEEEEKEVEEEQEPQHQQQQEEEEEEEEEVVEEQEDQQHQQEEQDKQKEVQEFGLSCDKFIIHHSLLENCTNDYFLPDSDGGDDTLESTWRTIMEGQGKTIRPQLKKSDTWGARIAKAEPFKRNGEGGAESVDDDPVAWAKKELKKSDTFNDRASLRREKSMSPEELNLRAEAFIKQFNNQIKLQRLESYQRFREMVNRGV